MLFITVESNNYRRSQWCIGRSHVSARHFRNHFRNHFVIIFVKAQHLVDLAATPPFRSHRRDFILFKLAIIVFFQLNCIPLCSWDCVNDENEISSNSTDQSAPPPTGHCFTSSVHDTVQISRFRVLFQIETFAPSVINFNSYIKTWMHWPVIVGNSHFILDSFVEVYEAEWKRDMWLITGDDCHPLCTEDQFDKYKSCY